jgi:hypothetical protein
MLKFSFIQTGKTSGDETTPYTVSLNKECTVGEFIDCVLKRNEWGYIGLKSYGHIFGSPNCEYRGDKIVKTEFTDEILSQKVLTVSASGGWSRMDYLITSK